MPLNQTNLLIREMEKLYGKGERLVVTMEHRKETIDYIKKTEKAYREAGKCRTMFKEK